MEATETMQYAAHASQLTDKARAAVKALTLAPGEDGADELQVIRIRSKKQEVIVTPTIENGHEFSVIVVQEPSAQ